jgi:hypothetical protein
MISSQYSRSCLSQQELIPKTAGEVEDRERRSSSGQLALEEVKSEISGTWKQKPKVEDQAHALVNYEL